MQQRIKNYKALTSCSSGTAKVWLGFASLHILAKHYQPLNRALVCIRKYQSMRFKLVLLIILVCCNACTSVKKVGIDEYKITVQGSPFDNIDDLKAKVKEEAIKVCISKKFEFVPNFFGDDFAFKQDAAYTPSGSSMSKSSAIATIKCI